MFALALFLTYGTVIAKGGFIGGWPSCPYFHSNLLEQNFISKHVVFHQTIDGNMKFRYSLIIFDPQIDEKPSHSDIKLNTNKSE
jgi:hypothetical protein